MKIRVFFLFFFSNTSSLIRNVPKQGHSYICAPVPSVCLAATHAAIWATGSVMKAEADSLSSLPGVVVCHPCWHAELRPAPKGWMNNDQRQARSFHFSLLVCTELSFHDSRRKRIISKMLPLHLNVGEINTACWNRSKAAHIYVDFRCKPIRE